MSLDTRPPRRPPEAVRDKPQVDRTEHGNLERAHARRHPHAAQAPACNGGWSRHGAGPAAWSTWR